MINNQGRQGYNNRDGNYRENHYQTRGMSPFVPPPQQNRPPPYGHREPNSAGPNRFVKF
jgi:hypothetical protein